MRLNIGELLLRGIVSGALEEAIQSADDDSVNVLLYGGTVCPFDSDPESLLADLRSAVEFFEQQTEVLGNLGAQARAVLPDDGGATSYSALKPLTESLVPFLTQAIEKINESGKSWALPINMRLKAIIESLKGIAQLQEEDEEKFRIHRSVTFSFQGPRNLVDDLEGELEALARRHQAASLSAYATSRRFRVTECQEGHVVILEGEKVNHTNVEVTQEMRESLEGKFLPPSEIKCPDSVQEEESEEEAAPAGSTS